jgi:hypothetical protein
MGKTANVLYGFGDASGLGFGSSIRLGDGTVLWKSGTWSHSFAAEKSSNYFELANLVFALEDLLEKGELADHEIFMFTDNSTAESAHFKGTSKSSKSLNDLALRLRKIEMQGSCKIFVIHVAGTRMIWQGTDGLSRGDENAGVMAGEDMLSYVPLHERAIDRSAELLPWVMSWISKAEWRRKVSLLQTEDWASPHPDGGVYLWVPPPAAAEAAIEFLSQSITKRPNSVHVILIPRLMTAWWRKRLIKTSDLLFTIPLNSPVWAKANHEPLICAVCLPLSRKKDGPWRHKDSTAAQRLQGRLPGVLEGRFGNARNLLRQLLGQAWAFSSV